MSNFSKKIGTNDIHNIYIHIPIWTSKFCVKILKNCILNKIIKNFGLSLASSLKIYIKAVYKPTSIKMGFH